MKINEKLIIIFILIKIFIFKIKILIMKKKITFIKDLKKIKLQENILNMNK